MYPVSTARGLTCVGAVERFLVARFARIGFDPLAAQLRRYADIGSTSTGRGPVNVKMQYVTARADQLAKLERYVAGSSVGHAFTKCAYVAIIGLAWLSAILFYVKQGDRNYAYVLSGGFAAVLTATLPWLYRRYQAEFWESVLTVESLRGVIGPTTLTVSDEGIEERGPVTTVRAAWRDTLRLDRSAARSFVVIAPLISIAIPATAFASESARLEFERMVTARCEAGLGDEG